MYSPITVPFALALCPSPWLLLCENEKHNEIVDVDAGIDVDVDVDVDIEIGKKE